MTAKHKAAYVFYRNIKLLGDKRTIACCIQDTGLTNYAIFRKTESLVSCISHRVNRVAQNENR
ncbi:hypothetical protein D3C71_1956710 [compost metagenome]